MITLGTFEATDEMKLLVSSAISGGRISYGPLCRRFEDEFAALHDCQYGIFTNSGTDSLRLALLALKILHRWPDGVEVIVPALTFVATLNAVYQCNMVPVPVDVEPDYYCIDPERIEDAITDSTVCILPVHLFGQSANMRAISDLAKLYHLCIVEDACETLRVRAGEKRVGAWGDAAAFSTYVAHIITTGVGGMTVTSNPDLALLIRSLANHGIDTSGLPIALRHDPGWLGRHFIFTHQGYSSRATELQAALGIPQLATVDDMLSRRRFHADYITNHLPTVLRKGAPQVRHEHAFMVYPLILDMPAVPMRHHLAAHNIESRSLLPLVNQPCYNFDPDDFPVASRLHTNGFYVGCHQNLAISDLDQMIEVITDYFE